VDRLLLVDDSHRDINAFELQELLPTHNTDGAAAREKEEKETREQRRERLRREKKQRARLEKLDQLREKDEMKFSHSLQFNSVPDWSGHYIAYSNLKKL
jgi:hypothetical protein